MDASWRRTSSSTARPVTASTRRMLEPMDDSAVILKAPMSPRARTWVPPHSSTEWRPASSTRTVSPYLSPKKAMAPSCWAWAMVVSKCRHGSLARISSLTRSSTSAIWAGVMAA